jgi:arginase family enzyme
MTYASFGCSLDVLDAPEKMAMKLAFLNALREGIITGPVARDPYELVVDALGDTPGLVTIGRLEIEPWMTPRPNIEAIDMIDVPLYTEFIDTGGCNVVSARLREFVRERVLPLTPLLIGVDHSLTGGVLEALRAAGDSDISLVVLDSHFDAIPASLRKAAGAGEVKDVADRGDADEEPPDSYTCGTWLAQVIESGVVAPERVAVIGPSDYPGTESADDEPEAMAAYRRAYLAFEERGVKVIPKQRVREIGVDAAAREAIESVAGSAVYLSIDADIGAGDEIKAVRFLDTIGLAMDEVIELCGALAREVRIAGASLAGFDIMEIDIHLADIPGSGDRTVEMCAKAAREIMRVSD